MEVIAVLLVLWQLVAVLEMLRRVVLVVVLVR
jgi:hypothetical protein